MFTAEALRRIIRISLQPITATRHPLYSFDAEEMLLMIAAHESGLGEFLWQIDGPARGPYQIEPDTMHDNYDNFLRTRAELRKQISEISGTKGADINALTHNPIFSTIHARLKLYRSPGNLPPASNVQAMAEYAKQFYNSPLGAATPEKYMADYLRLVR